MSDGVRRGETKGSCGRRGYGGIRSRGSRSCGHGGNVRNGGRGRKGSGPWLFGGSKKVGGSIVMYWFWVFGWIGSCSVEVGFSGGMLSGELGAS